MRGKHLFTLRHAHGNGCSDAALLMSSRIDRYRPLVRDEYRLPPSFFTLHLAVVCIQITAFGNINYLRYFSLKIGYLTVRK